MIFKIGGRLMRPSKKTTLLTLLMAALTLFTSCTFLSQGTPFSQEAVRGFLFSAFSNEYGTTQQRPMIRWEEDVHLSLQGAYTQEDYHHLLAFLDLLKEEVPALPTLLLLEEGSPISPNVTIHFVTRAKMPDILPDYVAPNRGFFTYRYQDYLMVEATVLIDSQMGPQERNSIVQEELINLLGLTNDIDFLPQSILYTGFPKPSNAAPVDFEMLAILYHPSLRPGMTREEAMKALLYIK